MDIHALKQLRVLVSIAALTCFSLTTSAQPGTNQPIVAPVIVENAVVKIFATSRNPDIYKPWTKESPSESTGSGVIIEGKRILSNAHVVSYASQVQVQANQSGTKYSATVEYIAPGIDLAILKLEDESFFDDHPPIPRARELPDIKEAVMVLGYPTGGSSLSITKGIVSRIEFVAYSFPTLGLRIQIDAAINPGNSGGPAVVGDRMIGLAFSRLGEADNIGYIIPAEEIDLFLQDIADGKYDGKPALYDELQTLENPALRSFLKLDKDVHGIVVHKPDGSSADYPLKEWDVITKIGDTPVDDEGMIRIGMNLRVRFPYLVQKINRNGTVPLTVVRGGKELKLDVPVPTRRALAIHPLEGTYPPYFICGPIVFSIATDQFIGGFMRPSGAARWMGWLGFRGSPLVSRIGDRAAFEGEQLVIVPSPFFPHRLSKGYSEPYYQVVRTVNNIAIKNLNHLVEVLRDSTDEFIIIEFNSRGGETLVFPRKDLMDSTEEILSDNGIRSQGSPDTMAIWNAKKQ